MFKELQDLFNWRGRQVTRIIKSLSPKVLDAARSMRVVLYGHDGEGVPDRLVNEIGSGALGFYSPGPDSIGVYPDRIAETERCSTLNIVLAHELIHATGHYKRLNRGGIGESTAPGKVFRAIPSVEAQAHEEVIAQYGGMLLLKKLGLHTRANEVDTERYLKKFHRPDGQPTDEQRLEAVRAVKYVLQRMEIARGGQDHAGEVA